MDEQLKVTPLNELKPRLEWVGKLYGMDLYVDISYQRQPDKKRELVQEYLRKASTFYAITGDRLIKAFDTYMDEWEELDRQLARLPWWRMIKYHRILNRMRDLTNDFERKYLDRQP